MTSTGDTSNGDIQCTKELCKEKSEATGTPVESGTGDTTEKKKTKKINSKKTGPNSKSHSTPKEETVTPIGINFGDSPREPNTGTVEADTKIHHSVPTQRSYRTVVKRFRPNQPVGQPRVSVELKEQKESGNDSNKLPEDLRLAIVYTDDHTKVMEEDTSVAIQGQLLKELDEFLVGMKSSQKPPRLVWTGNVRGVLRIDCIDQATVKWVRDLLLKQSFNPDGKYAVVLAQCLYAKKTREPRQVLRRVTCWVPGNEEIDFAVLMRRIQLLNPTLKATEWTKFGIYEKEGGRIVSFGIPEEHVKDLEAVECTAFGGLKMLSFRIKKKLDHQNE